MIEKKKQLLQTKEQFLLLFRFRIISLHLRILMTRAFSKEKIASLPEQTTFQLDTSEMYTGPLNSLITGLDFEEVSDRDVNNAAYQLFTVSRPKVNTTNKILQLTKNDIIKAYNNLTFLQLNEAEKIHLEIKTKVNLVDHLNF